MITFLRITGIIKIKRRWKTKEMKNEGDEDEKKYDWMVLVF